MSKPSSARPVKSQYQIMPDLLPLDYESLKRSIVDHGVDVSTIWDQDGNLIEGWHREKACQELGIDCPREVRRFDTEADKYELVLRVNCRRRQLNTHQKRQVIEAYLRVDPAVNDNHLGDLLGVSKNTVTAAREHLEATCQIDKLTEFRGRDGKTRPRDYRRIITNTSKELESAMATIKNLPPSCEGKVIDATTAARRTRRHLASEARAVQAAETITKLDIADIRLHHCPLQKLEQVAGIAPGTVNLLLTDIPYGKEFLGQLTDLAAMAARVLAEGGLMVCYTGQFYLPQYLQAFCEHLTYRWTIASVWRGDGTLVHPLQLTSKWKPIMIFSKGPWRTRGHWLDLSQAEVKEKAYHPWQQPLVEVEQLISYFSAPGDLVVDPCGGSFTSAVACTRRGRRFVGCDIDESCVETGRRRLALSDYPETATVPSSDDAEIIRLFGMSLEELKQFGDLMSQLP